MLPPSPRRRYAARCFILFDFSFEVIVLVDVLRVNSLQVRAQCRRLYSLQNLRNRRNNRFNRAGGD